jgi:hypothetical protein
MLWKATATGKCLCGCELVLTRKYVVEAKNHSEAVDLVRGALKNNLKRMSSKCEINVEIASCTGALEV